MNKGSGPLRVALLGCGVVGSQVARLLLNEADELQARIGRPFELVGIGVRTAGPRPGVPEELLTTDPSALLDEPGLDLVIEVMGGIEPARTLMLKAFSVGASVVTANKALLATHGAEVFAAAADAGVDLYYEASVAGAIPIIRPLAESLIGDRVIAVKGIVNGTTNYILDQMHSTGATFPEALAEAQQLGYAEADPTADVEGQDAAAKAALLASLAFHTGVTLNDVSCEGITAVTPEDIEAANDMGCVIKLLADCQLAGEDSIAVAVHPTMVPLDHPLAGIRGAYNAVFVESENAGRLMFMGPGAGGTPTASAIMGDVVTAARNRVRGVAGPRASLHSNRSIASASMSSSRYYVSMVVRDAPGVLARVADCFARGGVSLQSVRQAPHSTEGGGARLMVTTHVATDEAVRSTVSELETFADVRQGIRVLRVEGM